MTPLLFFCIISTVTAVLFFGTGFLLAHILTRHRIHTDKQSVTRLENEVSEMKERYRNNVEYIEEELENLRSGKKKDTLFMEHLKTKFQQYQKDMTGILDERTSLLTRNRELEEQLAKAAKALQTSFNVLQDLKRSTDNTPTFQRESQNMQTQINEIRDIREKLVNENRILRNALDEGKGLGG